MLKPLPIGFNEAAHVYRWEPTGEILARSVTGVTGWDMSAAKRIQLEKTRHEWEPRGNACHSALENFFKTGIRTEDTGPYKEWINPLLGKEYWKDFQPLLVEGRLCDLRKSVGGSCDVLGLDGDGKLVLMDLKTKKSGTSTYSTDKQLGAYASMFIDHYRMPLDEIRTIWCGPGKTSIGKDQGVHKCLTAWLDCWDHFRTFRPRF